MTTRTLQYFLSASVLSLALISAANCGGDDVGTSGTLAGSSSTSGSSSGEGGSGGKSCATDTDCLEPNSICEQNTCITSTCVNGTKDSGESDVDCGGAGCLPCGNGKVCTKADDCSSKSCNGAGAGGAGGMGGAGGAAGAGGGGVMTCSACATEADCAGAPGTYCDTGTCKPQKEGAAACKVDAECLSGFCPPLDGMCCNARCDNTCEACTAAKTGGTDGTCGAVKVDTDPDIECGDKGAVTCGANGTGCNGNNSTPGCNVYGNTTACAPASCTAGETKADSLCDGSGTCVAPAATSCTPYLCNGTATGCLTSCTTNAQCVNTHYCNTGTSKCEAKKANAATCASGSECNSGFCPNKDGVCCDVACDTLCRACVQSKTGAASGTCGNITGGTDPDNECSQLLMTNCNGAGQCGP